MTRKKISKKDLKRKVDRLRQSIETLVTGLERQQSRISAVQLQIDGLRSAGGTSEALASQEERQQELAQTTAALAVRVSGLEETAARLLGAGDEKRPLIAGLESLREELQRLRGDSEQLGSAVERTAAELRQRAEVVEDELRRLSDGQETLELKVALLAQEAEQAAEIPVMQGLVSPDSASAAQPAGQLEAVDRQLSELAGETGQLRSAEAELTRRAHSLEQRLASLTDTQALERSRLDGVLARADALERQAVQWSDQSGALLGRLEKLSEELQALRALGTDERIDRLERSMHEERARIGELQQTEQALGERLSAVISSAEGLFERIDSLAVGGGQLAEEVERLDGDLRKTSGDLNQQGESLRAQESRLGVLDESWQALQNSTESLGVQQARQGSDTRNLQQALRYRSILGLLAFVLIAAVLGFLLLRDPGVASETAVTIAELQRETTELRQEVVRFDASLAQIGGSMEALNAAQLPGRVKALDETVQNLIRAQAQQRQAQQRLVTDQEQLRADFDQAATDLKVVAQRAGDASGTAAPAATELSGQLSDLRASVENLVRENLHRQQAASELQENQAQMQTALAGVVEDVRMLRERSAPGPAVATAAAPVQLQRWEQARASGRYTLQLAGFFRPESLQWFVQRHSIGDGSVILQTEHRGRTWYVLLYGIYGTVAEAVAAASQLPAGLTAQHPWVRRIPSTGRLSLL